MFMLNNLSLYLMFHGYLSSSFFQFFFFGFMFYFCIGRLEKMVNNVAAKFGVCSSQNRVTSRNIAVKLEEKIFRMATTKVQSQFSLISSFVISIRLPTQLFSRLVEMTSCEWLTVNITCVHHHWY